MKTNVDALIEIPCFKCLFWDRKRESHLYCNPNTCPELTKWLLQQVEKHPQTEETLTLVNSRRINIRGKPNHKP